MLSSPEGRMLSCLLFSPHVFPLRVFSHLSMFTLALSLAGLGGLNILLRLDSCVCSLLSLHGSCAGLNAGLVFFLLLFSGR